MKKTPNQLRQMSARLLILFAFLSFFPVAVIAQPTTEEAFSPHQGSTALIVHTIAGAQKSVRVAAYSFTSRPIAQALIDAHKRGVDVRVVLNKIQRTSHRSVAPEMAAGGVPVRFNSHYAIMHDKFIIVDEVTLETGSFNFTQAAENRNAENVLVVHDDPKAVDAYMVQWEKLWGEAADK